MVGKLNRREIDSMRSFAETLAREAGEIQRRCFGRSNPIRYKGAVDLVTEVDRRCENIIIGRITDRFPDHEIVAEESKRLETGSPFTWYVDPLDGTTNYVHAYPCFGVSIGLAVEGDMVVGLVRDPMRDETFAATKGGGAFLDNTRVSVSRTRSLNHSLVATGFPYDVRESQENNIGHFGRILLACQGVRRDGSAALDLCYVAMGRFDGFWEMKLGPWDVAAGVLIVREAGGKVSDFGGSDFRIGSREVLATNGLIHAEMESILNQSQR